MVPLYSNKITRVPLYSRTTLNITPTGLSPSMVSFSKLFRLAYHCYWPNPFSLATTNGISIDFFSSGYLDVSVHRVCLLHLCIQCRIPLRVGFPIRISTDQSLFAAPRGFSQRTTSFIASRRQGIHQMPLRRLTRMTILTTHNGKYPSSITIARAPVSADNR